MATKAYLMIDMEKKYCNDGYYPNVLKELAAMPEVETVEPVSGICDLFVKVDAPIRVVFVANKIRAREWVKNIRILRVEPLETAETSKQAEPETLKLVRS